MINYQSIKNELKDIIRGEIFDDEEILKQYSRDASLFEVLPQLVIWPKSAKDVCEIVRFVAQKKKEDITKYKELSITARAGGSCMSGGPLNESIILDFTKYLNHFSIDKINQTAEVEPGVFYRDFESLSVKEGLILPCYTASKNMCALGGMIANNSAGEKTLYYGKMENFVEEMTVVLEDGREHIFKAFSRTEVLKKSFEHGIEGEIYERMLRLLDQNREKISNAKPKVSKNSAGYYLWNIEEKGMFNLAKIIVGSQGTLGIITKAKIKLVKTKPESKLLIIFMQKIDKLGDLINLVLRYEPESLESYDRSTLKLAFRFLPGLIKIMKSKLLKIIVSFLPEFFMLFKGGVPKLVLMAEFAGQTQTENDLKIKKLQKEVENLGFQTRITKNKTDSEKYWTIRRESFNLLRKHIRNKRTAPFIDDVCVEPKYLPEFLPKLTKILEESKIDYTIAGHAGNGNFHIIPLMDMSNPKSRALIPFLSDKVYDLVARYFGSITAEHNDGIVRTPYLNKMYNKEIIKLFEETKNIFDKYNIFNPGKKVPARSTNYSLGIHLPQERDVVGESGSVEFMMEHLIRD